MDSRESCWSMLTVSLEPSRWLHRSSGRFIESRSELKLVIKTWKVELRISPTPLRALQLILISDGFISSRRCDRSPFVDFQLASDEQLRREPWRTWKIKIHQNERSWRLNYRVKWMKYVCKRINCRVGMEMSFRFENQLAESWALWRRSSRSEESKVSWNLLKNARVICARVEVRILLEVYERKLEWRTWRVHQLLDFHNAIALFPACFWGFESSCWGGKALISFCGSE
jgi:hypothetical protein